jgi:hypothetical protein
MPSSPDSSLDPLVRILVGLVDKPERAHGANRDAGKAPSYVELAIWNSTYPQPARGYCWIE